MLEEVLGSVNNILVFVHACVCCIHIGCGVWCVFCSLAIVHLSTSLPHPFPSQRPSPELSATFLSQITWWWITGYGREREGEHTNCGVCV